ncbi:sensor histidine kinase [Vallitalea guaymasensis]|uniref:GHKL domain-containing protein n=1 Tax=Vallitalea guaymasensis TaxID=1185412 RepID=A0A8J8SBK9_9FIRM|nr:sensor histidine kinase [Vallitalea guaymasensis]QUH28451.1 GHKL domain-containing protein [Vallitalea guaymasensis]
MNNYMIENLAYIGTFPFIAAMAYYFFSNCFGCGINKKSYIVIVHFLYCLFSWVIFIFLSSSIINPLLNILLFILLSLFYKGNFKYKICAVFFFIAIIFLSDVMVQSLLLTTFYNYQTEMYILSLFLSKFMMFILIHIALQLISSYSVNAEGGLSRWNWSFLILCPILSVVGIYGLYNNYYIRSVKLSWLFPTLSIGLLFINFFVFVLFDRILKIKLMNVKTTVLEQQIDYYTHQYLLAEAAQKDTLRFRHDIKNVLISLQSQLRTGELSGSQQIVNELISDFNTTKGIANSGNLIVDSIINYKEKAVNALDITFHVDLRLPDDILLDSIAISVILGNALDNAIEACQKIYEDERYIKIKMHYQNEGLFINIENPYKGSIRQDITGNIYSSKLDYRSHGIGLNSIRTMVKKYNGLFNSTYINNIFRIEIVLFNVKRKNNY